MSEAITFHVAVRRRQRALEPLDLRGAEDRGRPPSASAAGWPSSRRGTIRMSSAKISSAGPWRQAR